jgi:NAD-dependent SIR2 family protein deacetylase
VLEFDLRLHDAAPLIEAMSEPTDRTVFLLGAGFSRAAGAPLIHDFLERSRSFLNDPPPGLDALGVEKFRSVFEFKAQMTKAREKINIDLDNVENFFGLVEMSCRLAKAPPAVRSDTVYLIAKTLELCLQPRGKRGCICCEVDEGNMEGLEHLRENGGIQGSHEKQLTLDLYDFFALLVGGLLDEPHNRERRHNTVITFNYDLVLDDALVRVGLSPWYGLGNCGDKSVPLLKLHGSANWGVCKQCGTPVIFPEKVTQSFSQLTSAPCPQCGQSGMQPLLVPPSWDKSEYCATMRPVWEAAVAELRRATRVCIIGYSLPDCDAFFRYLLTLALADNHQIERFLVVDHTNRGDLEPQTENVVQQKWLLLLDDIFKKRRFQFFENGFNGFLVDGRAYRELQRGERVHSVQSYG